MLHFNFQESTEKNCNFYKLPAESKSEGKKRAGGDAEAASVLSYLCIQHKKGQKINGTNPNRPKWLHRPCFACWREKKSFFYGCLAHQIQQMWQ